MFEVEKEGYELVMGGELVDATYRDEFGQGGSLFELMGVPALDGVHLADLDRGTWEVWHTHDGWVPQEEVVAMQDEYYEWLEHQYGL